MNIIYDNRFRCCCRSSGGTRSGQSNRAGHELTSRDHFLQFIRRRVNTRAYYPKARTTSLKQEWHETPRPAHILPIGFSHS
jgi:hypothetical protein